METTDKIALGVLVLILAATVVAAKDTDRYFFMGALIVYLAFYLLNKRHDVRKKRQAELEFEWKEEAAEQAYWGTQGAKESPQVPEGE